MDHQQATLKLAFEAFNAGQIAPAEALCRTLVQAGLVDAQLYFLLGMALHKTGREAEAGEWLERAAVLAPEVARIFSGLGCVRQAEGNSAAAARHFARAAELEPQQANHFFSLGNALSLLGEIPAAVLAFQQATALNPADAEGWNNLGKCLKDSNRVEESIAAYDRALALKPDYVLALQGRSLSLLASGRLKEGFRDYEHRWLTVRPRHFDQSRWTGEPIPGKTLFLHAEQGFGDGIQAARYPALLQGRCARVILECRPELKSLLAYSKVADEVIAYGEPLPPFDCYNSVISVPGMLGISLETLPNAPYLRAPAATSVPGNPTGRLKVGLVWAGNPTHHEDALRTIPLALWAPIVAVPNVDFFSLQVSVPKRDEATLHGWPHIQGPGVLADYLATATLVAQLDLVICVDTSVAHLAGALGKPVWTLIQHAPDWRWFLQFGNQTPWYPSMQLFRQAERGKWEPVMAEVAEQLRQRSNGHRPPG